MKRFLKSLRFTLLLLVVGLLSLAGQTQTTTALQQWTARYAGEWTLAFFPEEPIDQGIDFAIRIAPEGVEGELLYARVQPYCDGLRADWLTFRLRGDTLELIGTRWGGRRLDLPRVEHMMLYPSRSGLRLDLREAESGLWLDWALERMPPAGSAWACGQQDALIDLLKAGDYSLFDAEGRPHSLYSAFGMNAPEEDLHYLSKWLPTWPMYEEACVRAEFEIIWLGNVQPGSELCLFAIERTETEILLYRTETLSGSADGWFPLRRGPLAWVIIPGLFTRPLSHLNSL